MRLKPYRALSRPHSSDVTNIPRASGASAKPAPKASTPRTNCRYCDETKSAPGKAKFVANRHSSGVWKALSAKSRRSSIGWAHLRSHMRNTRSATFPTRSDDIVHRAVHPRSAPVMNAQSKHNRATTDRADPSQSTDPGSALRDSVTNINESSRAAAAAVASKAKIARHPLPEMSAPPATGPSASDKPAIAPQMRMAPARCAAVPEVWMSDSDIGTMRDEPRP